MPNPIKHEPIRRLVELKFDKNPFDLAGNERLLSRFLINWMSSVPSK